MTNGLINQVSLSITTPNDSISLLPERSYNVTMLKKLLLLSLTLVIVACTAKPTAIPTPRADQTDVEQQAVYAFLLPKMYKNKGYVIMTTSATSATGVENTSQSLDYVLQNMHDVAPETAESFRARNDTTYPIRPDMNLGFPYTLLSQAERNRIFGQNQSGWEIFYNRYPQAPGITMLSRVGFNTTFDQALVYIGTQSNWLAGSGQYILLKKAGGAWSIDQQVMVWIS